MIILTKEKIDKNPLLKLSFEFALLIVSYCEELELNKKDIIARQLLRSGTSIGSNSMEAQNAESKSDFIHKLKIAAKEAEETQYWLLICSFSGSYPNCDMLLLKLDALGKLLSSIISSLKKSQ